MILLIYFYAANSMTFLWIYSNLFFS